MNTEQETKARWGRSRFGGSQATLISVSLLAGAVLSIAAGLLFATLNFPGNFVLATLIMAAGLLPVLSVGCWALLLDRSTLRGATKNPEISVESQWYDKAAVGVFQDVLLVCGLGAAVLSFIEVQASIGLILAGVVGLAMADFGVRYWLIKRAEG
ncbi:hypothetical protein ACX5K5_00635 [Glutamicibacter bergerei]|uniref:Uncharacterized protein n=1 Tax=Glutamicibacter ardleyensis TaxID=225894 RepID=A0ABQ2DUL1_9MICC|nr:hypothetical protein [Glutamicibacter ardleyensis]GGJ67557.1 hypothetical protein GCM10007173_28040 [Glutamicibacter ardleyensis]